MLLVWNNHGLHVDHAVGYAHNASLFRRAALEGAGGYPSRSLGTDAALDGGSLQFGTRVLTRSEETKS